MLKLKSMSRMKGGSGNIIIASAASMITGAPSPRRPSVFRVPRVVVSAITVPSELVRTHQVRIDIGLRRLRRRITALHRLLELEDVSEHLRHGDIERRGNFAIDARGRVQRTRER